MRNKHIISQALQLLLTARKAKFDKTVANVEELEFSRISGMNDSKRSRQISWKFCGKKT